MNQISNWKQYLQEGQHNSVDAILDFGKRIYDFKQSCDSKSGGSTFTKDMDEWLGMSSATATEWVKIGGSERLLAIGEKLPNSHKSIYNLTTLSDEDFSEALETDVINPKATQADITEFKKMKNPPALGWQVMAKEVFLNDATRPTSWFTTNIKPIIEAVHGDFGHKIKPEDQAKFNNSIVQAHSQWVIDKGGVSEAEAEAEAALDGLDDKEKKRVERALTAWRKTIDIEIQERVTDELHKILPVYNKEHEKFKKFNAAYKGVFTKNQYKQLLSVLHSDKYVDGLDDLQKKKLDAMFSLIQDKRDELCGIKTESTGSLPSSVSDLMKQRKVK